MDFEELEKRIDENANKIQDNLNKIEQNLSKINNNERNIQKNSMAFEILRDYKKSNNRLYFVLVCMLILWIATLMLFYR